MDDLRGYALILPFPSTAPCLTTLPVRYAGNFSARFFDKGGEAKTGPSRFSENLAAEFRSSEAEEPRKSGLIPKSVSVDFGRGCSSSPSPSANSVGVVRREVLAGFDVRDRDWQGVSTTVCAVVFSYRCSLNRLSLPGQAANATAV
jgi:hypothetical protein